MNKSIIIFLLYLIRPENSSRAKRLFAIFQSLITINGYGPANNPVIGPYDMIFSLTYFSVPSPDRKGCDPIIGNPKGPGGNLGGLLVRSLITIKITQAKRMIVTLIFTVPLLSSFVRLGRADQILVILQRLMQS